MDTKETSNTTAGNDRELKIETNQINVSNRKNQAFYVYLCKKTLEQHEELVLHALGNATSVSVVAAEKLVRNGYAEYVSLVTKTIEVEESRRNNRDSRDNRKDENQNDGDKQIDQPRLVKRAKLLITLKRGKDFHENMKKFDEIKAENDKYIEAEKALRETNVEGQVA